MLAARPFARCSLLLVLVLAVLPAASSLAATVGYTDRVTFEASLGSFVVEDYTGIPNGIHGTGLDALLGPDVPIHRSTAGAANNQIGGGTYNATNSSFRLTFTNTVAGGAGGVFGAGFEYAQSIDQWSAFVTFADDSTQEFDLVAATFPSTVFFGVTSDLLIREIHVSLPGGQAGIANAAFFLDNLTWTVPEPGTFALVALGLLGIGARARATRG